MNEVRTAKWPSPAEFEAARAAMKHHEYRFHFQHPPEVVYRYMSQVDMLNFRAGSSKVEYTFEKAEGGGTISTGRARKGGLPFVYHELPYEWVHNKWGSADIYADSGPMAFMQFYFELTPSGTGTDLLFRVSRLSRFPRVVMTLASLAFIRQMRKMCPDMDAKIGRHDPLGIAPYSDPPAETGVRPDALAQKLMTVENDSAFAAKLAQFIATAPEHKLNRMRPPAVADQLELPEPQSIHFFLRATRAGLFDMTWDLLCPSCRGNKLRARHLSDVYGRVHCDSCAIDYEATGFDENVELSFRPAASIRPINELSYCIHSPSNTPHVFCQLNVWPGRPVEIETRLPEGLYKLNSMNHPGQARLEVHPDGIRELEIDFSSALPSGPVQIHPDARIRVRHNIDRMITVRIVADHYRDGALTAARASTIQEFRDLFSSEILRPDLQLGIRNLTILFTDLKESTSMYDRMGDAPAFSVVAGHFEVLTQAVRRNEGAVIKTIGDAIMAAFTDPAKALQAAVDIQRDMNAWNRSNSRDVVVKIGLHQGPCIAVTLNENLDYFGSMVNKAARIQALSVGGDIVLSAEMYAGVESVARRAGMRAESFRFELKGIQGTHALIRLTGIG